MPAKKFTVTTVHNSWNDLWYSVCIITSLHLCFSNSIAEDNRTFVTTPGDIHVLEHTTALFNWSHTIMGPVDLTWYYKGILDKPANDFIMLHSSNRTYTPATGDKHTRLHYTPKSQSASMSLDNVTSKDAGRYEARVVDIKDPVIGGFYIDNIATMTAVSASEIRYNITLGNMTTIQLSREDGIHVTLPGRSILASTQLMVLISVSSVVPAPQIQIDTLLDKKVYQERPCEDSHMCERDVVFFCNYAKHKSIKIDCSLDFPIQNLPMIHVVIPVLLSNCSSSECTESSSKCMDLRKECDDTTCRPATTCPEARRYLGALIGVIIFVVIAGLVALVVFINNRKENVASKNQRDHEERSDHETPM